ncbi:hypothetical protein G9A89_019886 [Geosiphon pyriformis]|nr:hypothetical protein G9A89_019886 [Geosiphon pyriformis]
MGTNAHDIWDFVRSVGRKTCIIDRHSVTYNRARCAVVCFNSAESLDAAVRTMPVLKNTNLCWFHLISVKCAKYEKLGHTSLGCVVGGKFSSGNLLRRVFSDANKSRLATIYAKHSASVVHPVSFGGFSWAKVVCGLSSLSLSSQNVLVDNGSFLEMKPPLLVMMEVNNRFAALERSLASLAEQVGKLAKRLDALGPMVFQPSPGCQPLVTLSSQDQGADVMMSEGLGAFTSGVNVAGAVFFNMSSVFKLEDSMKCLMKTCAFGVSTLYSMSSLIWKVATCNVRGMNNPTKQKDIIRWHKEMNNTVSMVTETKLRSKVCLWIVDKFNGVRVFISGLDSGHLDVGVAVVLDISLAHHVYKISEVPGWLLSIKLLFKGKLSVLILGLYAGASSVVWFSQAGEINSLIAKAVNESSFTVLDGDFNKDGSCKCASFRKCLDLGLANSLVRSPAVKISIWANSRDVRKTIDYVLVSSNLVNVIVHCGVSDANEYFEMDHWAVSVSLGLGGLLDMQLNSLHKQFNFKGADDVKWNKFKGAIAANAAMFSDDFIASWQFSDLDFKDYDGVFTKESSKFHKLELLISKLIKASWSICHDKFISLLDVWGFLDVDNASVVRSLFLSSSPLNTIRSALFKVRKTYCSLKIAKSRCVEKSQIKLAIEKRMESFKLNKDHTIWSVLEHPFCKVILDHLVVDDKLILEPGPVRSRVNNIMEGWTRKCRVHHQYWPLDYIFDEAFSGVMQSIEFLELFGMVSDLLISKAAGLSGISNELWIHNDRSVLDMLLVLLNSCLFYESVSALIKTACKILSKILSDRILLVCSAHDILCGDNFSVLKGTTIQTPIFAIGLVVENALEKNQKLWLVLQDMRKTYDSRCLVRIKMCGKFICFFSNIHRNWTNQVMMDFGLTDSYSVHNGLDQEEVFSPLLWRIFYDPLLCKVKHQESVCGYRLNSHFVSRSVGNSQTAIQHILNVASEFFRINDISINNDKIVAIPINARISNPSLFISGSPISITKKGKSHWYLGIFLSTDSISKPSLAKAHSDICFFSNLILKKVVLDKQFLYLVLAVLHPISLKLKAGLPLDFLSDTIYHPSFYGLKSFSQCQSENKVASLISFVNSCGVLGQLFSHRSHDLQVLCWHPIHPLSSPACIHVSVSNNFLSGIVHIFFECNLSLGGSLASSFWFHDGVPMFAVLGKSLFFNYLSSLRHYGIAFVDQLQNCHGDIFDWYTFKWWKKLDPCGSVSEWFGHSVAFLSGAPPSPLALSGVGPMDICDSDGFVSVCDHLSRVGTDSLSVYTDRSVKNLGTTGCRAGAAAFFKDIDLGLGVCVQDLMLSTLAELQAVVLALECVSVDCSVRLFLDSQAALDAYKSEVDLVCPDFRNWCWVERRHIRNIICGKNLKVSWHKVKGHSSVLGNNCANSIADTAALSD